MLKLRVLVVALSALAPMAHACNQTTSFGPNDPVVSQLMAEGAIHVAAPGDNVGVYAWNGELGAHVLRASWFDFSLVFTPIEIQPGDEVVYLPEAGGVPGGVELQGCADDPKTLDSVEVTTSLPGRGFLRLVGRGGGGRPVAVMTPRVQLQTEPLCASTPHERARNVGEQIKFENIVNLGGPLNARAFCDGNVGSGMDYEATLIGGSGIGVYRWTGQCDSASNAVYLTEIQSPGCR